MTGDVHVEGRRVRPQQVIMHGGDLETARDHFGHDRIDLGVQEHKVSHDHGTAMRGLECDPAAERQCRLDRHSVQRHREIRARKAVAVNVVRDGGLAAERLVDLLPVDVLRMGRRGEPFRSRRQNAGADADQGQDCFSHRAAPSSVLLFFDPAAAIDDEPHFLAVLHRLRGRAFRGGLDVPDLRIAGCLNLGDELFLGQRMGG